MNLYTFMGLDDVEEEEKNSSRKKCFIKRAIAYIKIRREASRVTRNNITRDLAGAHERLLAAFFTDAPMRLFSIITNATRQPNISIRNDSATQFLPSLSAFIRGGQVHRIQTRRFSEISSPSVKNAIEHEAPVAPVSNAIENLANTDTSATNNTGVTFSAKSDLKISPRHDLAMVFTCKIDLVSFHFGSSHRCSANLRVYIVFNVSVFLDAGQSWF
nr:DNL-type zinc finger protein [Tanacetum cinerariifolium]